MTSGIHRESSGTEPTPVTFSHPGIVTPLTAVGINEVSWAYNLITTSQSTYAGEVVQILGANVGEFSISLPFINRIQQERIRKWFLAYMTIAGLTRRDQRPVLMEYPERGWTLEIYPTSLPWGKAAEEPPAGETVITAEVAGEMRSELATVTMNNYTFSENFVDKFGTIGFSPAMEEDQRFDAETLGDNFNLLLASWMTGDYQRFGFNPTGDPTDYSASDVEMFAEKFGSEWIVKREGAGDSLDFVGEPSGELQIVSLIRDVFETNDVPARLGVAVALLESNLDPTAWNGTYAGLFQTSETGRSGDGEFLHEVTQATAAARAQSGSEPGPRTASSIVEHYPASSQIRDAARWFRAFADGETAETTGNGTLRAWAVRAQLGSESAVAGNAPFNAQNFPGYLERADELLEQAENQSGSGSTTQVGRPVEGGTVTSRFGPRWGRNHDGVDIGVAEGTALYAVVSGTVSHQLDMGGYGYYIILSGDDGDDYLYAHLMAGGYTTPNGARVEAGKQIGRSGNTGSSNGPHLHFEWHPGGYKNPVDPWPKIGRFFS